MSNYTNMMREAVARLQQERNAPQQKTEESMFALMTRQLGGDGVAESMAREILNEVSWEEGTYGDG